MALDVNYLFRFAQRLIRKNMAGGLTNTDFQFQWNDASYSYMDDMLGRWQARNSGKTGTNTGLIEDETIMQKLAAFTIEDTLTIADGVADKPDDFVYRLAMRISTYDCYKINPGQRSSVTHSVIDPPSITANAYYFLEYENYFSFLPTTVTAASLDYIKKPENIVWGYTWDDDGRQVYNAGLSTQSSWDDNSKREITKRMLSNLGVSFKDNDFANFGKSVEMTGTA